MQKPIYRCGEGIDPYGGHLQQVASQCQYSESTASKLARTAANCLTIASLGDAIEIGCPEKRL